MTPHQIISRRLSCDVDANHSHEEAEALATTLLDLLHQAGYVVVPAEPTVEMLWSAMERNSDLFGEIYRAMIEPLKPKA